MKFSLEELRQENEDKVRFSKLTAPSIATNALFSPINPPAQSKAMVKYQGKQDKEVSSNCKKHGTLQQVCAKLGTQRTKFNRWRRTGERAFSRSAFVSDAELDRLETLYNTARKAFHNEPCTCSK